MHPKLFSISLPAWLSKMLHTQQLTVYTYAVCIVLGALLACWFIKAKSKIQLNFSVPYTFFYSAFVAGFVGGKLFCYLERLAFYLQNPSQILESIFSGGFVCYGSVIFIAVFTLFYAYKNKISIWGFADVVATGTILTQIIGRLGCFFGGCCYGRSTASFVGIKFPTNISAHVHPTQLYEAALLTIVFIFLVHLLKHQKKHGQVFAAYVICYATIRFLLEFVRGDFRGFLFNGLLSHSQTIALITIFFSTLLLIKQKTNSINAS